MVYFYIYVQHYRILNEIAIYVYYETIKLTMLISIGSIDRSQETIVGFIFVQFCFLKNKPLFVFADFASIVLRTFPEF